MFAAIRRASSLVSNFVAERRQSFLKATGGRDEHRANSAPRWGEQWVMGLLRALGESSVLTKTSRADPSGWTSIATKSHASFRLLHHGRLVGRCTAPGTAFQIFGHKLSISRVVQ
jgi:hypothetical protein